MRSKSRKNAVIGFSAILSVGIIGGVVADDGGLSVNSIDTLPGAGAECEQVCAVPQRGPVDDEPPLGMLGYALFVQSATAARAKVIDVNGVGLGL
jgi:hypothetical protein